MKVERQSAFRIIILLFCSSLAGCVPHWETEKPPGGRGYGTRSFWVESWEPRAGTTDLHYWDDRKRDHLIWREPSDWLFDNKHNMALFEGSLNVKVSPSKVEEWWPRLFAIQGAGPPVDISDEIKLMYIEKNNVRSYSLGNYSVSLSKESRAKKNEDKFSFGVGKIGGDWGVIELTREEILKRIHQSKERGQLMKDAKTGLPYYKLEPIIE
jgi:hypothetical protein